jgi:hypothetical protein
MREAAQAELSGEINKEPNRTQPSQVPVSDSATAPATPSSSTHRSDTPFSTSSHPATPSSSTSANTDGPHGDLKIEVEDSKEGFMVQDLSFYLQAEADLRAPIGRNYVARNNHNQARS